MRSDVNDNSNNRSSAAGAPQGGDFMRKHIERTAAAAGTPPMQSCDGTAAHLQQFQEGFKNLMGTPLPGQATPEISCDSTATHLQQFQEGFKNLMSTPLPRQVAPEISCDTAADHLRKFRKAVQRPRIERPNIPPGSDISRNTERAQKERECRVTAEFFEAYDKYKRTSAEDECKAVKDFFKVYDKHKQTVTREWRDCPSIVEFFKEYQKFEQGQVTGQPAAVVYEKFGRAYQDFKRYCANKPEWNLPESVQASELYNFLPPNKNLWRARFTIKDLTPQKLEEALKQCVKDLGDKFRFSGYYTYDNKNNSIVYQFNNGLGDRPSPEICEYARAVLSQRLKQYGATKVESASTNDPDQPERVNPAKYPPENPKAKFQVPFGKTRGYTDQGKEFMETFESFAIHTELGFDKNKQMFTMIDAHILSVGGVNKKGEPYGPYKEAVGLILAEHDEDLKKICRAGVVLGQEFLAFENFQDGTVIGASKKKQKTIGQKTSSDVD